jgi:hypothetical protein
MNVDELVTAYLNIRGKREELKRNYEAADAVLKEELEQLQSQMLEVCNEMNVSSLKTGHGTVIRQIKERFFCGDWGGFYDFIRENGAVELLEKRIHQGNFRQFLDEHTGDGLPPGVNVMREYAIVVRKANA